jgi:hypothetical protein
MGVHPKKECETFRRHPGWSRLVLVLCLAPACSKRPVPSIAITSPADGAMVTATPDVSGTEIGLDVDLVFEVHDFALKAVGDCKGAPRCGHVQIHVDGDACNESHATGKAPFNEEAIASPTSADLIYCKDVTIGVDGVKGLDGPHVVTLGLFDDEEQPLKDEADRPIATDVHFVLQVIQPPGAGGAGGGGP